jgi:hypothetical protein
MYNASLNFMLDPSLLLAEETSGRALDMADELAKDAQVFVPHSLMRFLEDYSDRVGFEAPARFAQFYGQRNEPYMEQEEPVVSLNDLYYELSERAHISPFRPDPDVELPLHLGFEYFLSSALGENGEEDPYLGECILEEWVFLQERSLISSRLRRPFDRMVQAGGVGIEMGKRAFDTAVRKTRRKDQQVEITHVDRVIAVGKWTVIGSSAAIASNLITPPGGVIFGANIATGLMFLIDP